MATRKMLHKQKKVDKLNSKNATRIYKERVMGSDMKNEIAKEANALARDVSRFRTLYPNGEAKLKENPSRGFAYLNSAEMIALNNTAAK